MSKIVVIINGNGGVGKDTLCEIVGKYYKVMNVSSIDPIKKIASENGWNEEKSNKSRKFLADLKKLFVEYNDLPKIYLEKKYQEFLISNQEIMFVHIREGEEIQKFKNCVKEVPCITLLIRGGEGRSQKWGNASDDAVENYEYDFYYENIKSLEAVEHDFMSYFDTIVSKDGANEYETI